MEDNMDECMAKPISGTQYFCLHFIGQILITWLQFKYKGGLEIQSSCVPRKINKTDVLMSWAT